MESKSMKKRYLRFKVNEVLIEEDLPGVAFIVFPIDYIFPELKGIKPRGKTNLTKRVIYLREDYKNCLAFLLHEMTHILSKEPSTKGEGGHTENFAKILTELCEKYFKKTGVFLDTRGYKRIYQKGAYGRG